MKSLNNVQATVTGNRITLTADIVEKDFSRFPVQQTTILHGSETNPQHHRHVQISQEAVFIRVPGKQFGVAFERKILVELATAIEPKLNYVPLLRLNPHTPLKVDFPKELEANLQWQISDDGKTWTDIAGQTTNALDRSKLPIRKQVRLKASGPFGEMMTNSVIT